MIDKFGGINADLDSPADFAASVTPSDSADIATASRGLYVGGTGDMAVTMLSGGSVTFKAVPAGSILPIRVSRVLVTGTTATSIVALY